MGDETTEPQQHVHSYAEYQRRKRAGEDPCEACSEANRQYARHHRLAQGSGRAFNFPVERPSRFRSGLGATIARSFRESA